MSDERKDVEAALSAFYAAEAKLFGGDTEPMKEVWSRAGDVTYLSPTGGFRVGWDEVMADWQVQADMRMGGRVVPQGIRVFVEPGSSIAVVQNFERGDSRRERRAGVGAVAIGDAGGARRFTNAQGGRPGNGREGRVTWIERSEIRGRFATLPWAVPGIPCLASGNIKTLFAPKSSQSAARKWETVTKSKTATVS
ncbi:MAG: hypothetical protein U9Q81_09995 [Pseudomonadota bacterium]|nr:hypothetical protein [Pseudomonadota bacterium]